MTEAHTAARSTAPTERDFYAFLDGLDPAKFNLEDEDKRAELRKAFESYNVVKDKMLALYKGELKDALGITIDKKGERAIETFLKEQAINDPDGFKELQEKLVHAGTKEDEVRRLRKQVDAAGDIDEHRDKLDTYEKHDEHLKNAREVHALQRFFKWGKEGRAARKAEDALRAAGYTGSLDEVEEQLEENRAEAEGIVDADERLEKIDEAREDVLAVLAEDGALVKQIEDAANVQLEKLMKGKGLERFEDMQEIAENLGEFLEKVKGHDADKFKKEMDEKIKLAAGLELHRILGDHKPTKKNGEGVRLQAALAPMWKMERIGPFEGSDAVQAFIKGELLREATDKKETSKIFLIHTVLEKLKKS